MSQSAEALGLPLVFQFGGKSYQLAPIDHLEVIALYETYLEEQAWRALQRARKFLNAQEYEEQEDGLRRDLVTGVFSYSSKHWLQSLKNLANLKHLAWLMASYYDRDLRREDVEPWFRDAAKMKELVGLLFAGKVDPNEPAPAPRPA
jgi:hypothetical protein